MKKLLLILFIPFFISCENDDPEGLTPLPAMIQAEEPSAFECINAQADNPPTLENAKKWIVGKWQLKAMITMIQNSEVPNYQVEFKEDGGVFVSKAGELIYTDAYSLIEGEQFENPAIQIITDNLMPNSTEGDLVIGNEGSIIKGWVRICENELMLDHGIAFDAPGYLFRKME